MIHAFRHIADKYADIRLVVAGDGDFQLYLSQCRDLQGRVSFLGKVSSSEVEDVYRSAYIGVMPSFHEQCSYTAIEMMRHKIPFDWYGYNWVGGDVGCHTGVARIH